MYRCTPGSLLLLAWYRVIVSERFLQKLLDGGAEVRQTVCLTSMFL